MTVNLLVFAISTLLIGVGVTAAFGWAWALIVLGVIGASLAIAISLIGEQ